MPTVLTSQCCRDYLYIRIHRREGTKRVLSDAEITVWAKRIQETVAKEHFSGRIFVLWGTDHENQPIINANKLFEALPQELRFDWKVSRYTINHNIIHPLPCF